MMNRAAKATAVWAVCLALLWTGCTTAPTEPEATPVFSTQTFAPAPTQAAAPTEAPPPSPTPSYEAITKIGDDLPVSRAMAAKMLALAYSDRPSIDTAEREIDFADVAEDAWYDRFINAAIQLEIMSGGGATFTPEEPLSVAQAQTLLDRLDANNPIKIQITDDNRDKPISYALWTDLYIQLLRNLSDGDMEGRFGVYMTTAIVLAVPESNPRLPEGHLIAADGPLVCAGLHMEPYLDKETQILRKDKDIVAVIGITDTAPTIQGAFIAGRTAETITIFVGGAERTYEYDTKDLPEGSLCRIQINGNAASSVDILAEEVTGVIKSMRADSIELEEAGILPTSANLKIYSTADGVPKWRSIHALTVGTDIARFAIHEGQIVAAVIDKEAAPDRIRVVLSTTGFSGYAHDEVIVSGSHGFTLSYGGQEREYPAGESFTVSPLAHADLFGQNRIYLAPAENGTLTVESISRNWPGNAAPQYRGALEIAKNENGGFLIVNELSLEEYLYAVVPSEMPSGHGLEASKVQAITARSYAYNQLLANRYYRYGANVDDSVSCQVYNNIPENEISIQAVDDTMGQCLSYRGEIISANYFSTSAGMTANAGEVWADSASRAFPAESAGYLRAVPQLVSGRPDDLSVEANAAAFFTDWDVDSYDSAFSWFRWKVTMTGAELSASINRAIQTRYAANPKLIKTLQADGTYASRPIASIGDLQGIEPVSRGEGGNLTCLRLIGTEATILVYTEYNIRLLLSPVQHTGGAGIVLARKDGSTVVNYTLMPSAFFVMDTEVSGSALASVTFHGGGNGHGVGMSQNGVKGMIDAGFSGEQILRHYYPGSLIMGIYK